MNKALSSSTLFIEKWKLHYAKETKIYNFKDIGGISFIKGKFLPVFSSVGGSLLMNSNSYIIKENEESNFKNKLLVIYNVPNYNNITKGTTTDSELKIKRIPEYEAYMADFSEYDSINDYFSKQVGRKKIGNIKRRKKKLEKCFNISYKLFYKTAIPKDEYADLMNAFKALLVEKFKSRKEFYSVTDNYFWDFYSDTILPMIANGEASLYVVYNNKKPISFYLCYHIESLSVGVIPVFDINYYKFGLGSITIMNLFEELAEKGFNKFDFYKGEYGYKKDWCNKIYNYEYHLVYKKSILSSLLSTIIAAKFKLKQYLRKKGVNDFYYKTIFKLKNRKKEETKHYQTTPLLDIDTANLNPKPLSLFENSNSELKKEIYNFLYANNLHIDIIELFELENDSYLIKNNSNNTYLKLS
ncbi:GNAT family N-acetyltransferase [Algibacter sp. AS12]|uniref:GNAT family N-acetyltransferase n=1 Tax=Algibacter sp. AS12 TaxID=3135773 RepID=UPI00398B2D00